MSNYGQIRKGAIKKEEPTKEEPAKKSGSRFLDKPPNIKMRKNKHNITDFRKKKWGKVIDENEVDFEDLRQAYQLILENEVKKLETAHKKKKYLKIVKVMYSVAERENAQFEAIKGFRKKNKRYTHPFDKCRMRSISISDRNWAKFHLLAIQKNISVSRLIVESVFKETHHEEKVRNTQTEIIKDI